MGNTVEENAKKIAQYLAAAFNGVPTVRRYWSAGNTRYVDIIKTFHSDGVCYLGTIGGYRRIMSKNPTANIRVEFISAVSEKYEEIMAQTLGFLILQLDNTEEFYHPEQLIENAVPQNSLSTMKHVYLCDPFLWESGLPSLPLEDYHVAFLHVLPITESEYTFFKQNGAAAFEKFLAANQTEYFNMQRKTK